MCCSDRSGSHGTEQRKESGSGGQRGLHKHKCHCVIQAELMMAGTKVVVGNGQKWVDSGIFKDLVADQM